MSLIYCLGKIDLKENAGKEKLPSFKRAHERSWSGNLRHKPNYQRTISRSNLGPANKSRIIPPLVHRIHNVGSTYDSGAQTPRLVRSSGMRRDWSFEDVRRAIEG
ncbi:hypothetical protein ACS0TY_001498 [Phlomoides rotata]